MGINVTMRHANRKGTIDSPVYVAFLPRLLISVCAAYFSDEHPECVGQ